ncbi:hypothetical protein ACQQ2N_21170 [Dokdonella sp. MW10]|uniref:hypothetical protein n=1 Tax=Dokdonella sp. MW10 TaxID=2992926 RepID=UPI003F7F9BCB
MNARAWLHLAALLAPLVAALLLAWVVFQGELLETPWRAPALAAPGVIAAQLVAWWRWPALERRAVAGEGAWLTGLGMAALTHVLFGVLLVVALMIAAGPRAYFGESGAWSVAGQIVFFMLASLGATGWLSFPLTAGLAQAIAALRRKELSRDTR